MVKPVKCEKEKNQEDRASARQGSTSGMVRDDRAWIASYKSRGGVVIMAADLLARTM